MRRTTYYVFQSATAPDLRGITGDPDGRMLPTTDGPWTLERQITPEHRAAEQHTALGPNPYKVSVSS